jgi:integrase
MSSILKRGGSSWRLKIPVPADGVGGRARIHYATVRGSRKDAERELGRLVNALHEGTLVNPNRITVGGYLQTWLQNPHNGLAGKTCERYRQLLERQIVPHLGVIPLQKLRPSHITDWHGKLLTAGGADGRPLAPRTVGHAHRLLQKGLNLALTAELIARNVARAVKVPKVQAEEIKILKAGEITAVLATIKGHELEPLVVLALSSGARRGELLGLSWGCVDLSVGSIRIERSLEQTAGGLKFKRPKTRNGLRSISLPPVAVEALQALWRKTLERRMALGQGRPGPDTLVFTDFDGDALKPDNISRWWREFVYAQGLPRVCFHALRHTAASSLIAAGIDPVSVSKLLGHARASITLDVYSHLFERRDDQIAKAMQAALTGRRE